MKKCSKKCSKLKGVVFSAVFAAVASLMCAGCRKDDASASSQPVPATVQTIPLTTQTAQVHRPTPALAGLEAAQPDDGTPIIRFVTPRLIPFRMDLQPELDITGTPFSQDAVVQAHVRRILEAEFKHYPPGVLKSAVNLIIVFNTLAVNGHNAGGTYAPGIVFIAAGEYSVGEAWENHIAQIFHHEASSNFLLSPHWPLFDQARFRAANPPGFVYSNEVEGAGPAKAYTAADSIPSPMELGDGFLVPYGRSVLEQDFNSYAQILLWRPELLLRVFAPDSAVGRKARVVRDFYIAIDKRFETMFALAGE